ncbi:transposase [Elizabethkingia sp. JS20170427COW]|uniref:transposase n=1 Tax=Elizabethkingia sp. JS20170427COW TaxID=2583851 RepID=UPI0011101480|nr:transposase [Elizabethkingia sp. JS20170427COW]QCX52428.1 transposase [Elizabethkingia sp. JS20170427COW]
MIPLEFGRYYHIYNHANGEDLLFREEKNYTFFLEKYHKYLDSVVETIAWCLMPNHFHLLVRIKSDEEIADHPGFENLDGLSDKEKSNLISKQFSNFFNSYTKAFNKVYQRRGSLFLKNFKRKEITDDKYFRNLILYLHNNPVHHRFTTDFEKYPWTSYQSFIHQQSDYLIQYFDDVKNYHHAHKIYHTTIEMEFEE